MLHNGLWTLPFLNDDVWNADETVFSPNSSFQFSTWERYPGAGDYKANAKVVSGTVTWFGWITNSTVTPTSLTATNLTQTTAQFNFTAAAKYYCPRYLYEFDPGAVGSSGGAKYTLETETNTRTGSGTESEVYTINGDGTIYCTCLSTTSGSSSASLNKEASLYIDLPESYEWTSHRDTNSLSSANRCNLGVSAPQVWASVPLSTSVPSGTRLYTDANLTTPYNNSATEFHNFAGTYSVVIASGYTSGSMAADCN